MGQTPPTQAMPPAGPPGPPPSGGSPNRGPLIVAGAIVLVGLMIVIALVLLLGGNDSKTPPPSPSPTGTPTETETPTETPTRSPSSPTPTPTEMPPPVDNTLLVREAVERSANADRPGEVKHIGNVTFYKDSACATREGASANVRYTSAPKLGVWLLCKNPGGRWKVTQGPIYGE